MTTAWRSAMAATVTKLRLVRVVVVLAVSPPAEAQQAGKVYRIGYLAQGSGSGGANLRPLEGFRQGLRELGWVEGQNIVIDYRYAEGQIDRLPALAAELVQLKVAQQGCGVRPIALSMREVPAVVSGIGCPDRLPGIGCGPSGRPGARSGHRAASF